MNVSASRAVTPRVVDGELLSPSATFRVFGRLHPLQGIRIELEFEAGLSITEILERCNGASSSRKWHGDFVVYIDEHPILRENYRKIRVKAGATVTFLPRLAGGASSGVYRQVLGIVTALAAVAASIYVPGLFTIAGMALTSTTAALVGAIAATSVTLAGTMALDALFPIRPARLAVDAASVPSAIFGGFPPPASPRTGRGYSTPANLRNSFLARRRGWNGLPISSPARHIHPHASLSAEPVDARSSDGYGDIFKRS